MTAVDAASPVAAPPAPRGLAGWLCPTDMDRARVVDMHERVRVARRIQVGSLGGVAAVAAPWLGWWLLAVVLVAVAILVTLERAMRRLPDPSVASFSTIALLQLVVALAVAGTGGAHSPMLAWLSVPTVMFASRFRPRVVTFGVAGSVVITVGAVGVAEVLPPAAAAPTALLLLAYAALLVSLVTAVVVLLQAELQSRGDAVVDPLTGLFNRKALHVRFEQAAAQARVLGGSVCVLLFDLDRFKAINDTHGHDRGDVVLAEVAYQMRKTLRSYDLVYRIGGEEFLVLLPGQDASGGRAVAERVRQDLAAARPGGLAVTVSAGIAALSGADIGYDELLRHADIALYEAKRRGRNCTVMR